jgi:hypothetical protein
VDAAASGSCAVAGFGIGGVELTIGFCYQRVS